MTDKPTKLPEPVASVVVAENVRLDIKQDGMSLTIAVKKRPEHAAEVLPFAKKDGDQAPS